MTEAHTLGGNRAGQLRGFVDRIERLEWEKDVLQVGIKEIYGAAKLAGLKKTIVRKLVAERRRDRAELDEERALLDLYRDALAGTPLAAAADAASGVGDQVLDARQKGVG